MKSLSRVRLFATPWTVAYQAPQATVHGIFQARILEWVAISFSRGSSQPRDWTWVSFIAGRCFTIWTTWKPRCLKSLIKYLSAFLSIYLVALVMRSWIYPKYLVNCDAWTKVGKHSFNTFVTLMYWMEISFISDVLLSLLIAFPHSGRVWMSQEKRGQQNLALRE